MDLQLAGARAIVTGGSRGIGLAVARGLRAEGARVALVARHEERLRAAAAELGPEVLAVPADTTDDAAVRAMVERVVGAWGGVDVLVNAAAQPAGGARARAGRPDRRRGPGRLRHQGAGLPPLRPRGGPAHDGAGRGRIVNISGLNARRTGSIAGGIRNVAVAALTANLADELGPSGVGVTVVHPGLVETERTPRLVADRAAASGRTEEQVRADLAAGSSLRRLVTAEEVANVVVFLCSPLAVAVTGDAVGVGGGNRGAVHY